MYGPVRSNSLMKNSQIFKLQNTQKEYEAIEIESAFIIHMNPIERVAAHRENLENKW